MEVLLQTSKTFDEERREKRNEIFREYIVENPEIAKHKHRNLLIRGGIASHHAGHIPAWKLLIEKVMSAGLLDAIFATMTVAAGVDFPARTVVISNADKRGNNGWQTLSASELQQMTGRAGRRGKDNVGFVVLTPSRFQNPKRIAELLSSNPDPLQSQFRATYTSLLNLLDAYGNFEHVREIAEKSFAFRETATQISRLEKDKISFENEIKNRFQGLNLTLKDAFGFERLVSARIRLQETLPTSRAELRQGWLKENVVSGRIIATNRSGKNFLLVLQIHGDKVSVMNEVGEGSSFPLQKITRVFAKKYPLVENSVEIAFEEIHSGKNPVLEEPKLSDTRQEAEASAQFLTELIDNFPSDKLTLEERETQILALYDVFDEADSIQKIDRDIEYLRNEVWLPFERRARVLSHFGYLDFQTEKVSGRGKWLADLRIDRTLLVGEALSQGFFEALSPELLAALMAALASDPDRNFGEYHLSEKLLDTIGYFENIIGEVAKIEWKNGVEPAPDLNLSASATAERWAKGVDWEDLVRDAKAEEGDLVRLLSRTGEALMQIAHLKESNPKVAEIARIAAEKILREPIR